MRKLLLALVLLLGAAIALPPLYYAAFTPPLPELPPAGRRIPVSDGVSVNAIERGAGPAVVLVHGLPGCAYDWAPLADALAARGMHAIAYDRVGYGYSDARSDGEYTVEANARELVALLASEGLRDATLVGWSYGGPVAISAATLDASRIGRLVLLGSGGPSDEPLEPPALVRFFSKRPVARWIGAVPPVAHALQAAVTRAAFSDAAQPAWWLPQVQANFGMPATRVTYWMEGAALASPGAFDPAAAKRPILLIHGDDDRLAPLAISEWIQRHAPGSELVVVPGGSHMLLITHVDLVADRIAAFAAPAPPPEPVPAATAPDVP